MAAWRSILRSPSDSLSFSALKVSAFVASHLFGEVRQRWHSVMNFFKGCFLYDRMNLLDAVSAPNQYGNNYDNATYGVAHDDLRSKAHD